LLKVVTFLCSLLLFVASGKEGYGVAVEKHGGELGGLI